MSFAFPCSSWLQQHSRGALLSWALHQSTLLSITRTRLNDITTSSYQPSIHFLLPLITIYLLHSHISLPGCSRFFECIEYFGQHVKHCSNCQRHMTHITHCDLLVNCLQWNPPSSAEWMEWNLNINQLLGSVCKANLSLRRLGQQTHKSTHSADISLLLLLLACVSLFT